jgi:hypothetical protein
LAVSQPGVTTIRLPPGSDADYYGNSKYAAGVLHKPVDVDAPLRVMARYCD